MRTFAIVLVYSLVVVGLHVLAYVNPEPDDWGFHHYPFLSQIWLIAGAAASVLLFLLAWTTRPGKEGFRLHPAVGTLLVAAVGGILFWVARGHGHFLGDGPSRIESLLQGRFLWYLEPGGILVPYQAFRISGAGDPATVFAAISVASGVVYLALAALFAREAAGDAWGRGIGFGLLALAGVTRLFYGFVETFALLAALAILYLVVTFYYLRGKGSPWVVALTGTLVVAVHTSGLLLLPSMVYALWKGGNREATARARGLAPLILPVLALIAGQVIMQTRGYGLGDVIGYYGSNLLPLAGGSGPTVQYPLLSVDHVLDFLQQEILVGPFAALFAILLLVLGAQWRLGREGMFLLLAGVPWWMFSFLLNQPIGAARQWVMFAPAAIPFIMLIGIALVRIPWRRDHPRLAAALAGILLATSLFHTLPWVGVGTTEDRALAHFVGLYAPGTKASPFARSYAFDQVGTYYLGRGQLDNARMAYMEAVTADTTNGYAASHLGSILLSSGETRRAAALLAWAIRQDPDREYLHFELGNAYRELGAPDSAAAAYRRAVELNPDFRQAYINLVVVERQQGRLDEAERVLRQAMEVYPGDGQLLANLGRLHQARGDTLDAIETYKQALERDPGSGDAAYNLANLLMLQQRFEEAIPYFEMVVNRNPRDAEAWVNLGVARGFVNDEPGAMQAFQQALISDPNRPEPYFNIFRGLITRGDTTRAITVMQAYAERDSTTRFGALARRLLMELGVEP